MSRLHLITVPIGFLLLLAAGSYSLIGGTSTPVPPRQRIKADFQSIGSAIKTYRITAGCYPTTEQGLKALVERPATDPFPDDWVQFLTQVPADPWKREYQYRLVSDEPEPQFELWSLGRDGINGTKDDQSSLER